MTGRKRPTEAQYAEAVEVLPLLIAHVRELEARHRATDATTRAAVDANAEAYAAVVEAVHALRDLVAAVTDGAGHDGRYDLADTLAHAHTILGHA